MLLLSRSSGNLNRGKSFDETINNELSHKKYHRSQSEFYRESSPFDKTSLHDELDDPSKEKLSSSEENLFATMKLEINRLNTFIGRWPLTYVKPDHLAGNGFFYLQTEDRVQCAFCHIILDDWNVGQKPLKEHIKNSPRCPFLLSSNVGNVPFVQPQPVSKVSTTNNAPVNFSNYKPKHPRMAKLQERLNTYRNWPHISLSAQQLAECGFYYTGHSVEDEVTCFFCGGSLGNWELTDDPWIEHSKFFPNCAHLKLVKTRTGMHRQNSAPAQPALVSHIATSGSNSASIETQIVKEACNIFPKSLVEKIALKHLKETHSHYTSLTDLCEAILEYSERNNSSSFSHDVTGHSNYADPIEIEEKNENFNAESPVNTSGACAITNDEEKNQQPSKAPRDFLLCKICMDQEMGIVFQPCGHLVACPKCAQLIFTCPLCRTPVTSKVRTYLG